MKIKLLAKTLILVLVSSVTLSVMAQNSTPQTPEDCQRIYEGDDALIQACIDYVKR